MPTTSAKARSQTVTPRPDFSSPLLPAKINRDQGSRRRGRPDEGDEGRRWLMCEAVSAGAALGALLLQLSLYLLSRKRRKELEQLKRRKLEREQEQQRLKNSQEQAGRVR